MFKKPLSKSLKNLFLALFGAVLSIVVASTAFAQQVTQEEATRIKAYFEQKIKQTTDIQKIAGDTYEWQGDIVVEPSGNYFAITLPYLKIKQMNGQKIDIGMLAINAVPSADNTEWKTAVAIPTPIRIYDKLGALEYKIDIKEQRLNGLFLSEASQFLKLSGQMKNVTVTNAANVTVANIPDAYIKYDFNVVQPNVWDGNYIFKAENIDFNMPDEQISGKIGSVFFEGDGKGLKINTIQDFQEKMGAAAQNIEAGEITNNAQSQAAKDSLGQIGEALFGYLTDFGDSTTGVFGITDLSIQLPDPLNPANTQNLTFGKIAFDVGMHNVRSDNASISYGIELLGLGLPSGNDLGPLAAYSDYMPKDIAVRIKMVDVPYQKLVGTFGESISQFMSMAPGASMQTSQLPDFKQMILQSDSKVILENTYVGNDLYRIQTDVNVSMAPNSAYMVKGNAVTKITGLEDLLAKIQQDVSSSQDPAFQAQGQQALGMLAMVQMMGQAKEENGKKVHVYDFQLQENGQMLLNGTDLAQIMGAMGGRGAPQ